MKVTLIIFAAALIVSSLFNSKLIEERDELQKDLKACELKQTLNSTDAFSNGFVLVQKEILLKDHESEKVVRIDYTNVVDHNTDTLNWAEGKSFFLIQLPEKNGIGNIKIITEEAQFYLINK